MKFDNTQVDTVVIGAGQAGIAMSEHLSANDISHVVLERDRIAERWRTQRWDSLVANGPAWHDRFPGLEFSDVDKDSFVKKDSIAAYFEQYAEKFSAPVHTGVEVTQVTPLSSSPGFLVETSQGNIIAQRIVSATGAFQLPSIPAIVPNEDVNQIHSSQYRNPEQLNDGAVLVVGAGSSGVQIAKELRQAGKEVFLSVGPHDRPPRAYRGKDFVWWLGVLGKWDEAAMKPGLEHVTIAVSGAEGGKTVDFRELAHDGITLLGRTETFNDGTLTFASDLNQNIAQGDENYLSLLDEADAYIERNGLDFPLEPQARIRLEDPECMTNPVLSLNLQQYGITNIIWATGFNVDYSWLKCDVLDERGYPVHQRGIAPVRGVYFLGLPWLSRRGSTFIWGVWHDAKYIAGHIQTQRSYEDYAL